MDSAKTLSRGTHQHRRFQDVRLVNTGAHLFNRSHHCATALMDKPDSTVAAKNQGYFRHSVGPSDVVCVHSDNDLGYIMTIHVLKCS